MSKDKKACSSHVQIIRTTSADSGTFQYAPASFGYMTMIDM
jgi:hypothetical protein